MSNPFKEWLEDMQREETVSKSKGMCIYCDPDSSRTCIWQDNLTKDWYFNIKTDEWDEHNDEYVTIKEYVNYCPYCGRSLY